MRSDKPMALVPAKAAVHEEAAHQKRNWVRLTYDCNDRCVFCLDAHTHDGTNRDREEVRAQILDGRRKGAERLILSGGEPTIHPDFVAFVKLGRLAGYEKVQTVTNGRMFAYPEFLKRSLDAGLGEITFSIHGPNARVHDALVGTRGAFDQEVRGLQNALEDGRPIINIDVCVNRGNVKVLPRILERFVAMGVKEYDLLHVIPFGRAYTEGKDTLFYDLEAMRPYLLEAFEYSKRPDIHIWLNRFPVPHLEGYESLIQDPYKLGDEVRGRKEEFAQLLDRGIPLDCREPTRCGYCYLEPLCDRLDDARAQLAGSNFERVRIDTTFEASMPEVYGGDPATKKRVEALSQIADEAHAGSAAGRKRLPVLGAGAPVEYPSLAEQVRRAASPRVWVVAPTMTDAVAAVSSFGTIDSVELELELDDWAGLDGHAALPRVRRVVAKNVEDAQALLELAGGTFEVALTLTQQSAEWLRGLESLPGRLSLVQPTWARASDSAASDVDVQAFFASISEDVPVEGLPRCVVGPRYRATPETLDASTLTTEGRLEIFRFTRRYVESAYRVKSLRCADCRFNTACDGVHVNYVRAHGFAALQPVT